MTMKDVKTSLLERTSVRRYEREPIPQETMDMIYKAVENTPTSYNGQQFSVIDISDQELKEKLYELTNQKQLKTCNRLLIFCSDYNKITRLAEKKGFDVPPWWLHRQPASEATAWALCARWIRQKSPNS